MPNEVFQGPRVVEGLGKERQRQFRNKSVGSLDNQSIWGALIKKERFKKHVVAVSMSVPSTHTS